MAIGQAEAKAPAAQNGRKAKIINTTAAAIHFNYTADLGEEVAGRPPKFAPPKILVVPSHVNDLRGVTITGDVYEAVTKLEMFKDLEASGAIIVDRTMDAGTERRVATEPEMPASLKAATTVGSRVAQVGTIGIGVSKKTPA